MIRGDFDRTGRELGAGWDDQEVMMEVREGDVIEIVTNKVQRAPRRGTVSDVLQDDPLKLEVDWEDGHQSIFEPRGGNLRVVERDG